MSESGIGFFILLIAWSKKFRRSSSPLCISYWDLLFFKFFSDEGSLTKSEVKDYYKNLKEQLPLSKKVKGRYISPWSHETEKRLIDTLVLSSIKTHCYEMHVDFLMPYDTDLLESKKSWRYCLMRMGVPILP